MANNNINNIIDKVPPQSLEAEAALIGAMLIEKEAVTNAMDIVNEDDFYKEVHREIFSAICDLVNKNQPVDAITLADKLNKSALFSEVGAGFYLTSLIDSVQTAANVEEYAHIVRNKSLFRKLIKAGSEIVTVAFNEKDTPEIILDRSQTNLLNLSQGSKDKTIQKIGALAQDTLELLAKLHANKNDVPGLRTHFDDLDILTGGLQPSELIIIAARPSMGKTAFALNIAENVAIKENKPVLIFSLEMSAEELIRRMVSSISRVSLQALRKGYFNKDGDWTKITNAMSSIAQAPIYIDVTSGLNIMEMRSRARRMSMELKNKGTPLSLIMVDYLQLMTGTGKYDNNRVLEVAEISRYLKALAKDLKIPVIALSQLSRATESRSPGKGGGMANRPVLSDLRDSGAIEQDADVVAFIHREWAYNKTDPDKEKAASIIVAKQRNGPTDDIQLVFEGQYTKFENAAKSHS